MPRLSHDESDSGRSDVTQTLHGTPSTIQYTLPTILPVLGFIEGNASFSPSFLGIPERRSRKSSASGRVFGPTLDRPLFFAETGNLLRGASEKVLLSIYASLNLRVILPANGVKWARSR
ncbi:hypothetical protein FALCPG4_009039 [Fusarium falciforme]